MSTLKSRRCSAAPGSRAAALALVSTGTDIVALASACGMAKDCTSTSPCCNSGSSWCVEPAQPFGVSQAMRQTGCGHVEAGLHFQVHLGCSQTLWQDWDLGHCSMHIGSEQCDEQAAQSGPEQGRWGQSTAQCGSPQPILHWERSTPLQRVWHFGLSHSGLHSWSQTGFVHCQAHCCVQCSARGEKSSSRDATLRRKKALPGDGAARGGAEARLDEGARGGVELMLRSTSRSAASNSACFCAA
mmetsp:Transcript_108693/g.302156  ORF Transcript_108693/g.302156 Transcript_108693/m.302156 type:complete len:243 (+) Transcript_108693:135-863(+)